MLTLERAIEHADAIVAERGPDFVYNPNGAGRCAYVPRSDSRFPKKTPFIGDAVNIASGAHVCGCLVGEIIERAGLMTDEIAGASMGICRLINHNMLQVGPNVFEFLVKLQQTQDSGQTWGECLAAAKDYIEVRALIERNR